MSKTLIKTIYCDKCGAPFSGSNKTQIHLCPDCRKEEKKRFEKKRFDRVREE